ncbi:hypothetical protein N0V93_003152 [Gnomoniopsis smithogilvyi]|uniref:CFEM domain-containing protein n=1 Tax=Gnomoniopsis smithogilvyi TaxID=1191159 RepID=A0A9W8Z065_9PEZI|nr:hypothetical protein N0V93_003152 [Gnomoniopsis smithogilvyi]
MMQLPTLLASAAILIGPVFAQSTSNSGSTSVSASTTSMTATASGATSANIVSLVDQLPTCALPCLSSAATAINCTASDLPCLCSKSSQLATNIGPCVLFSSCSSDDQTKLLNSATEICQNLDSAQPAQVAAASSYIASAVASESASTASGNIAVRTDAPVAGVGVMGAAAALAMLAL